MPKFALNGKPRDFLNNHILGRRRHRPQRITAAHADYLRRASKIQEALLALAPDAAAKRRIEGELSAAQRLAEGDRFEEAYRRLDQAKRDARQLAAGAQKQASRISTGELMIAVGELEQDLDAAWRLAREVNEDIEALEHPARNAIIRAGKGPARGEEFDRLRLLGDELPRRATSLESHIRKLDLPERIAHLRARIEAVERAGTEAQKRHVATVRSEFEDTLERNRLNGTDLWDLDLVTRAWECAGTLETWWTENIQFEHLDARNEARLARARTEMRRAKAKDQFKTLAGAHRQKSGQTEMRRFRIEDLDLALKSDMDEEAVAEAAERGAQKLRELMASEVARNPNGDVVLDLMLKSREDFADMVAGQLGLSRDASAWTPVEIEIVDSCAGRLHAALLESAPNRPLATGDALVIGGRTYRREKVLGMGGNGLAYRYVDDFGSTKVVKRFKGAAREAIVREALMHRRAMGGEDGAPHPNVVPLTGVAIFPTDLALIMDEAECGSCEQMGLSILAAQVSGALPQAAREALTRNMFFQAVSGMKRVHDANMMHNDIKSANFLVAGDGTIQVADFGSVQVTDAEGMMELEESDEGQDARELALESVTQELDEVSGRVAVLESRLDETDEPGQIADAGSRAEISDELGKLSQRRATLLAAQSELATPGRPAIRRLGNDPSHVVPPVIAKTEAYAPKELMVDDAIRSSTKSDVFQLGAMLNVMTQDFFDADLLPGGGGAPGYADSSRDTGHDTTALDRLRNRMLAPDPKDRPSLDQVLSSACLEMGELPVGAAGEDGDNSIAELQAAVAAYSNAAGAAIKKPQREIAKSIARVRGAQKLLEAARAVLPGAENAAHAAQGAGAEDARAALEKLLALLGKKRKNFEFRYFLEFEKAERARQAELRAEIRKIHEDPSIAALLAKIELCSRPFVGRYAPEEHVETTAEQGQEKLREKGKEKEKEKGAD